MRWSFRPLCCVYVYLRNRLEGEKKMHLSVLSSYLPFLLHYLRSPKDKYNTGGEKKKSPQDFENISSKRNRVFLLFSDFGCMSLCPHFHVLLPNCWNGRKNRYDPSLKTQMVMVHFSQSSCADLKCLDFCPRCRGSHHKQWVLLCVISDLWHYLTTCLCKLRGFIQKISRLNMKNRNWEAQTRLWSGTGHQD